VPTLLSFRDVHDVEHDVRDLTPQLVDRFHLARGRRRHGEATVCPDCRRPVHLVRRWQRWLVAHDPGHGADACELATIASQVHHAESPEHRDTKTRLVLGARRAGWDAEVEWRAGSGDGAVRLDVFAWPRVVKRADRHQPRPFEVQVSP
jgi:hypothetical protein